LIEGLIKKSSFIYRNPLLYSVILIFLLVLIGSFVLERSKLHTVFFRNARENRLPVMGPVYREFGLRRIENCCIGQVLELTDNGLYMETKDEEGCNVVFSENTRFLSGKDIKVGDLVMIMGELTDGEIIAFGIRKIEDIDNFYWQQPMNHGFPKRIGPPER
jgi:acetyltransferase-like isoleucine patch superfamily enzyme